MTSRRNTLIDSPHDKLVRRLLSSPATARDILDIYLPAEIRALVDLDILERQPDTYVDAKHRKHEIDVLFKTRCTNTEDDAYIWVLIEQQRDPDVWLPLRIFCYMTAIWDNFRKQSGSRSKSVRIPFIYPLVISNASKPYHHSLSLADIISPKEARHAFENMLKEPIQLIDLAAIPDETLRAKLQDHVSAQALLLSLKHVFDDNLQNIMETVLLSAFQTLDKTGFRDDVADLLYYLYNEGNLHDQDKFWSFLHSQFSTGVEEKIMTLGQQDRLKAAQQAVRETALRMLEKKIDIALISEVTHLPPEEIRRLASKKVN